MANRIDLIEQYTRQGLSKKAIELLRLELSMHPDRAHLHALLAFNLLREKRLASAEHEALLALKAGPELPNAHIVHGSVQLVRQRYEKAKESFAQAVALSPNDPEAHEGLGRCLQHLGDLKAAEECYLEARSLDPSSSSPHFRLAALALDRRDLALAESEAQEALSLEPEDPDNLVLMGMIRYHQWRMAEAHEACRQALRINPEHAQARRLLCWLKAREMPLLAPWWNFSAYIGRLDQSGRIGTLVGMYLACRLVRLVLIDVGLPQVARLVGWIWLAFCIYTWFSPAIFEWIVEREKRQVELNEDF